MLGLLEAMPTWLFTWSFQHYQAFTLNWSKKICLCRFNIFLTVGNSAPEYIRGICIRYRFGLCSVSLDFTAFTINSCNNSSLKTTFSCTSQWSFFINETPYALFSKVITRQMTHSSIMLGYTKAIFSKWTVKEILSRNICSGEILSHFGCQADPLNDKRRIRNYTRQSYLKRLLKFLSVCSLQLLIAPIWPDS